MRKLALLIVISSIFTFGLYSQEGKLEFLQKSVSESGYMVSFIVNNTNNQNNLDNALDDLLRSKQVIDGKYYSTVSKEIKYQLSITDISAEEVRDILLKNNLDYNFNSISIDGVTQNGYSSQNSSHPGSSKTLVTSKGFPQNNGNTETDAIDYKNKKDKWIEENPEEYQKLLKEIDNK